VTLLLCILCLVRKPHDDLSVSRKLILESRRGILDTIRAQLSASEDLVATAESFFRIGLPDKASLALQKALAYVERIRSHIDDVRLPYSAHRAELSTQLARIENRIREASQRRAA
jgi:hypothetical protein